MNADATERDTATSLLLDATGGDTPSVEALVPLVYAELRRIAHRQLRDQRADHTLGTTALVHEAYLKLIHQDEADYAGRAHFCAVAATAMRSILIDYARRRSAQRRGGNPERVPLTDRHVAIDDEVVSLLALDEALTRLGEHDERLARVVEQRFFGGMTMEEVALVHDVSVRTIERDWKRARAYLRVAMDEA